MFLRLVIQRDVRDRFRINVSIQDNFRGSHKITLFLTPRRGQKQDQRVGCAPVIVFQLSLSERNIKLREKDYNEVAVHQHLERASIAFTRYTRKKI